MSTKNQDKQETISDIVAEMRGARTEFPFVYLMGEPDTPEVIDVKTKEIVEPRKINIRRVTVNELADRIEAVWKREREEIVGAVSELRDGMCIHCDMQLQCAVGEDGMATTCNAMAIVNNFINRYKKLEVSDEFPF